jgi:glycosyltransferase involved in cell wall biosynthesis
LSVTAFVIPWFGRDLVGGAEQQIFQVATRLASRGHRVEVLTTCCRSFADDWNENQLGKGTSEDSGVRVRRFPVRPRDVAAFDAANRELLEFNDRPKSVGTCPVSERAARTFVDENIHSPKLLNYLERKAHRYHAVIFAPYLYGPTLLGVERARGRAFLQPLLHDETYAYLPAVDRIFHLAKSILFISEGEAMLAARLFGPAMRRKGVITGGGVEVPDLSARSDEGKMVGVSPGSYLLYLGRRDPTKNTDLLVRAFRHYRASRPHPGLQLVLAGPGDLSAEDETIPGLLDVGLVSKVRKAWLLAHCRALVQPSRNESSITGQSWCIRNALPPASPWGRQAAVGPRLPRRNGRNSLCSSKRRKLRNWQRAGNEGGSTPKKTRTGRQ